MKIRLMITLIAACVSLVSHADTCPPIQNLDPLNPPAGWSLLIPPVIEDQVYHFGGAVHSLNGSFYYQQVICLYETCHSFGCPTFKLLSQQTYAQPDSKVAPWDGRPVIAYTLVCAPADHDPSHCVFQ